MNYSGVCLEGYGYALPEKVITSEQIEEGLSSLYKKFGVSPGLLQGLTGVKERRVWDMGTLPSTIATEAAHKALLMADIPPRSIDAVVHTGVCRDSLEPATAIRVHNNLGLSSKCLAFDVSNACLGFLNGMFTVANMIELGQINSALVVTGENAAPLYKKTSELLQKELDEKSFRDSFASLTLGSAGVAFVLTKKNLSRKMHQFLGGVVKVDSSAHKLCIGDGTLQELSMKTDATELMRKGLILSKKSWGGFKEQLGWSDDTIDHFITHQISARHHSKGFEILDLPLSKGYSYLENLGNTGSAAAPLSLVLTAEKNKFAKNDLIAMLGIGSGISTTMVGIRW
jgi:acyl-CoA:acyl-CoA alkyltransferase